MKGRATTSENRKFFIAVMEGTLGIVKKMLTNGGFVKLLWAYVVLARGRKQEGKYVTAAAVVSVKCCFWIIHFCQSSGILG